MTDSIKTEVSKLGEALRAIEGIVLTAEEVAFPELNPPSWVHPIGLLTRLALIEYDKLEVKAGVGSGAGYER